VNLLMLQCGNIVLLTLRFLNAAKFTILTPLSLLISCQLLIPCCQFENVFSAYFGIETK
jgi:hypothetical protein